MITPAQRAEIRRLYVGEHWKIGTLAAALGVHHETVRAALQHGTGGTRRGVSRPSALDPFLPFIRDTLAQYPRLRATRLHAMLRQRGYLGSAVQVRRLVRRMRPQAVTHVYRRVVTLAGEQAQVDWGTFGTVRIGHGVRVVSGFVMVLGYSRALFALFTLDHTLESFLRGHVAAFQALGGSARTLVYDNLRSAVLDRRGTAIQCHPRLLELAGHYHFAPLSLPETRSAREEPSTGWEQRGQNASQNLRHAVRAIPDDRKRVWRHPAAGPSGGTPSAAPRAPIRRRDVRSDGANRRGAGLGRLCCRSAVVPPAERAHPCPARGECATRDSRPGTAGGSGATTARSTR